MGECDLSCKEEFGLYTGRQQGTAVSATHTGVGGPSAGNFVHLQICRAITIFRGSEGSSHSATL